MNKFCIEIPEIPKFSDEDNKLLIEKAQQNNKYFAYNIRNNGEVFRDPERGNFGVEGGRRGFFSHRLKEYEEDYEFSKNLIAKNNIGVNWDYVEPVFQKITWGLNPHSDGPERRITLLYNLYGPASTTFYDTKETWRPYRVWLEEDVTPVYKVKMKLNTWYLFHNYEIHSVELDPGVEFRCAFVLNISKAVGSWDDAVSNWKQAFTNL